MKRRSSDLVGGLAVVSSVQEKEAGRPAKSVSLELDRARLYSFRNQGQRLRKSTQARIGGERTQEGLRAYELLGRATHVVGRQKQEAVLFEELATLGFLHRLEVGTILGELGGQAACSVARQFRRVAIHHHENGVDQLRKGRVKPQFTLAPGKLRREKFARIGLDREVLIAVEASTESYQQGHDQRQPRIAAAPPNNADDYSFNHIDSEQARVPGICAETKGKAAASEFGFVVHKYGKPPVASLQQCDDRMRESI